MSSAFVDRASLFGGAAVVFSAAAAEAAGGLTTAGCCVAGWPASVGVCDTSQKTPIKALTPAAAAAPR
ncbi:MAG: hypothetical protein ABSG03_18915 [Bryobacteraceae bacterium]